MIQTMSLNQCLVSANIVFLDKKEVNLLIYYTLLLKDSGGTQ
jgi:hypothetical protein